MQDHAHYMIHEKKNHRKSKLEFNASFKSISETVIEMQVDHRNYNRLRLRFRSQSRSQTSRQSAQFCRRYRTFSVKPSRCSQPCAWIKQTTTNMGSGQLRRDGANISPFRVKNKISDLNISVDVVDALNISHFRCRLKYR